MTLRAGRWLWLLLLVFTLPLAPLAGRFCRLGAMDAAYHGFVALHRILPQIVLAASFASIVTVLFGLKRVRDRLRLLESLASEAPTTLSDAFGAEARVIGIAPPHIAYLTTPAPICFTAAGAQRASIFVSHGFIRDLDERHVRLIAHHELLHVRDRHATWNVFWHVLFAAFILPGFDGVERALRGRREARTHAAASRSAPDSYANLLFRDLGPRRRPTTAPLASLAAPVAAGAVLAALAASHVAFMLELPYLPAHHC